MSGFWIWSVAVPTVRPPLTRLTVTSPVLPEETKVVEALLPFTAAAVTVPMVSSLTVKLTSSGRAVAGAPEKSMASAVRVTEEPGV